LVETIKLKYEVEWLTITPLSADVKASIRKRLVQMDVEDKERADREEARNTLEVTIYKCKELQWEDDTSNFATETEMETLKNLASEASEWLEDHAETAPKVELDKQKALLAPLHTKIAHRKREFETRPVLIEKFKDVLNQSITLAGVINNTLISTANLTQEAAVNATNTNTTSIMDGLYTQSELDNLVKVIERESKWLSDMIFKQEALASTEDPVLESKDLEARIKPLNYINKGLNLVDRVTNRASRSSSSKTYTKTAKAAKKTKTASAETTSETESSESKSADSTEESEAASSEPESEGESQESKSEESEETAEEKTEETSEEAQEEAPESARDEKDL
jgi:hypothetical protein